MPNKVGLFLGWFLLLSGCATTPRELPVISSYKEAVESLPSGDFNRRLAAVQYLGDSRNPLAITHLAGLLSDEDILVRLEVTLALRNFNSALTIEPLRKALEDDDVNVRFSAASALFELDDYSGEEVLIEGLASPREEFRWQALLFLGKMRSPTAAPAISLLLKDSRPRIRSTAAYILGLYQEPSAVDQLLEAMDDPVWYVRKDAWEALRKITDQDFEFSPNGSMEMRKREKKVWLNWRAQQISEEKVTGDE